MKLNETKPITTEIVHTLFIECLMLANNVFGTNEWAISPIGIQIFNGESCFGKANSEGVVKIHEFFLGTKSYSKLRNTFKHELSHLKVGIEQGHNVLFENAFNQLGGTQDQPSDLDDIFMKIGFDYHVFEVLDDGLEIYKGGLFEKNKSMFTGVIQDKYCKITGKKVVSYKLLPINP